MQYATGWVRDFTDPRDFSIDTEKVKPYLLPCKAFDAKGKDLPSQYDIASYVDVPPIKNQRNIGSCTAHAGTTMYETFLRVAGHSSEPLSRLFLYKVTRNLLKWTGDTGGYLRTTMQAMAMFGIPLEEYCTYVTRRYEREPSGFLYAMAQNFQALTYYRLDLKTNKEKVINSIKLNLASNRACMCGFVVFSNLGETGDVRLPGPRAQMEGGHAICIQGYDDDRRVGSFKGAFKFPNSWGTGWGEDGYGWLPYDYVRQDLATDWWTLHKGEWLDLDCFK